MANLSRSASFEGVVLDAEQPPQVEPGLGDVVVVVLDEAGALPHHPFPERVEQLSVALVVDHGEQARALVVPGQRVLIVRGAGGAHGRGQSGEGGLGQQALVVPAGARARVVMDGDLVAGLTVVEPAGPRGDAQADQHGVVGEVHGVGHLVVWGCRRVQTGTFKAAASVGFAASRRGARTA